MNNKNSRYIGVAIIVGILALGAFYYLSTTEDELGPGQPSVSAPDSPERTQEPAQEPSETADSPAEEAPTEDTSANVPEQTPPDIEAFDKEFLEEQKRITTAYKSLTRLHMELPPNMEFMEVDGDKDVAILYGSQISGNSKMAIVASRKTAGPEGIAAFLNENKDSFPMLKDSGFKISGKVRTMNAPEESGLGKITLIPGGSKNGQEVWAAHVQRKDGAGSYLFILEDRSSVFHQSEERFDALLNTMKAK